MWSSTVRCESCRSLPPPQQAVCPIATCVLSMSGRPLSVGASCQCQTAATLSCEWYSVHVTTLLASLHALLCRLPVCHRYSVMTDSCWDMNPDKRATFLQLKKTFDRLITAALDQDWPYMDLAFVVHEQLRGELQLGRYVVWW